MESIKIIMAFVFSFLITLMIMVIVPGPSELEQYDKMIAQLMIQEGLTSADETLDRFPELKKLRAQMNQATFLHHLIQDKVRCPAPAYAAAESRQLQDDMQRMRELRRGLRVKLNQLMVRYNSMNP